MTACASPSGGQENLGSKSFGPHREKICLRGFANNKGTDQPDQRLCYSLIGLDLLQAKFQFSS